METRPNTIAQFAIALPWSIPTLEKLGIDYCCGGQQTIVEACRRAGVTPGELLALCDQGPRTTDRDWQSEPMSALIGFIVGQHHKYTSNAIDTLAPLAAKVRDRHGARHDETRQIETLVNRLSAELIPHMLKEEQILFPYIGALEASAASGHEPPMPFFGTAKNPVRMMMAEHEAAAEILLEIRTLATNYTLPADACTSFRGLYATLQELEADLHRHIHLENNILFPRAISVEESERKTLPVASLEHHCCGSGKC